MGRVLPLQFVFGEGEETDASLLEEVESAPVEESGGVLEFIDHLATEETILFWCLLGGLFLLGVGMMIRGYRMMKRQKAEELKKDLASNLQRDLDQINQLANDSYRKTKTEPFEPVEPVDPVVSQTSKTNSIDHFKSSFLNRYNPERTEEKAIELS